MAQLEVVVGHTSSRTSRAAGRVAEGRPREGRQEASRGKASHQVETGGGHKGRGAVAMQE
jgi:hypothetical protein